MFSLVLRPSSNLPTVLYQPAKKRFAAMQNRVPWTRLG